MFLAQGMITDASADENNRRPLSVDLKTKLVKHSRKQARVLFFFFSFFFFFLHKDAAVQVFGYSQAVFQKMVITKEILFHANE